MASSGAVSQTKSVADTVEEDELPEDLIGQPTYRGIPKRYEDTKPFHTQKLSHTNILKIGAVYHQELMDKLEKEKLDAISSAVEQSEKQAAQKLKAEVEKLHEYATADRERALRQQKIVHDQQLTEEKMKIESQLNRFWQVKLEEAIEEKDLEMRRAVERTREACMAEIDAMIAKARKEERQLAIEEQEKAKREHDEKLRKEREDAMKDKESAMAKMRKFLEDEKDTAVAAAKIQEQNLAASELATIISAQTAKLMEIEEEIKKRDMEISVRDSAVANLETVKKQLMTDLNDQKLRLEYFVDSVRHFVPGQNEHLIDKRGTKDYIPEVTPIIEGTDF